MKKNILLLFLIGICLSVNAQNVLRSLRRILRWQEVRALCIQFRCASILRHLKATHLSISAIMDGMALGIIMAMFISTHTIL